MDRVDVDRDVDPLPLLPHHHRLDRFAQSRALRRAQQDLVPPHALDSRQRRGRGALDARAGERLDRFLEAAAADQRLRRLGAEAVEDAHELALLARRVAVEHLHGDVGELAPEALLHLLRAEADRLQHLAAAERALRRQRPAQSAVVADEQRAAAVHRHRHAAVAAAKVVAALAAEEIRRVAAAIDEDDGLLAGAEDVAQRRLQRRGEDDEAFILLLRALVPQVDDIGLGQWPRLDALRHPQQYVFAARRVLARLQRRRGAAEDHGDAAQLRAHDREVAGVVARRLVLLVRAVAFLVDDDDAEPLERDEERRARADGDVDLAAPRAPPLTAALARGEAAGQDGDAVAEALLEPRREDGRERDLRDEEQRLPAVSHDFPHDLDIDLGLAAAGHAFEEERLERAERRAHGVDGGPLLRRISNFLGRAFEPREEGVERVPPRAALDAHDRFLRQRAEDRGGDAGVLERRDRHLAAALFEELDGVLLLRRERARGCFEHDEAVVADALRVAEVIGDRDDAGVAQARHGGARAGLDRRGVRERAAAQHLDQRLVAGDARARVRIGERDLAPPARGHVRRQGHAQHLADRREVVLRGPAAEVEDLGDERRLVVVEDGADRFDVFRRRFVAQPDDEAGRALRAERHFDARAEADVVAELGRDRVDERAVDCDRQRDVGEFREAHQRRTKSATTAAAATAMEVSPPKPRSRLRGVVVKLISNGVESWLSRAICEPATTTRPPPFTPAIRSVAVPLVNCGKRSAMSVVTCRSASMYICFVASVAPRASNNVIVMSRGTPATSAMDR